MTKTTKTTVYILLSQDRYKLKIVKATADFKTKLELIKNN